MLSLIQLLPDEWFKGRNGELRLAILFCVSVPLTIGLLLWVFIEFGFLALFSFVLMVVLLAGPYCVARAIYTIPMKQLLITEYDLEGVPVSGEIVEVFKDETKSSSPSSGQNLWKLIKYTCPEDKGVYQRKVPADEAEYRWQLPTRPAQAMRYIRGFPRSGYPFYLINSERDRASSSREVCMLLSVGIPMTILFTIVVAPWTLTDLWFKKFHAAAFVSIVTFGLFGAYFLANLEFSNWKTNMLLGAKDGMGLVRNMPTNLTPEVEMEEPRPHILSHLTRPYSQVGNLQSTWSPTEAYSSHGVEVQNGNGTRNGHANVVADDERYHDFDEEDGLDDDCTSIQFSIS